MLQVMPPKPKQYLEPFGGGGAILLGLPPDPGRLDIYNDYNADLANLFLCVRDRPLALCRELGYLPIHSRAEFEFLKAFVAHEVQQLEYFQEECEIAEQYFTPEETKELLAVLRGKAKLHDVRRAAAFYKISRGSFSGTRSSFGVKPIKIRSFFYLIYEASVRLEPVVIESKDALQIILERDNANGVTYCDPPYYMAESNYETVFTRDMHGTYTVTVTVTAKDAAGTTLTSTKTACTEGIVMLYDVSNAQFRDCRFYENDGYNMFALNDCWDVLFEDAEIHDNRSGDPQYPVIDDEGSADIVFRRCTFKDNYCDPDPRDYADTVFEDCDILVPERDEQYVGYARMLGTSDDGSFIYLRINEVTWISWDDEELMAHYGITRDDMPNDYYIADDAEEYFPCVAYADSVKFSILKPDPQYGSPAPTPVDMAEFVSCFDAYDGKLLVTFATGGKEYGGYTSLSEISQLYVP